MGTAVWGGLVVGLFIFFCATVGLVGAVPAVGPMCVGMGFGVVMGVCLICILVMSGWVLGLPLLPSALAVDAADAFDGVSRVFSYLFAAPWAYLITAVGATCFACLPAVAVMAIGRWAFFPGTQFADCLIHLNLWWSGKMATAELTEQFYRPLLLLAVTAALAFCGLCVSLTHTYLLLRRHVDGTEIEKE